MYGGAPKWDQMKKYQQGVHAIIACPGRLNDFLEGRQVQALRRDIFKQNVHLGGSCLSPHYFRIEVNRVRKLATWIQQFPGSLEAFVRV